jgi:MFS family permease
MLPGRDGITVVRVRDLHGRSYRVGERPHDIMARSRDWMLWLPWAAMAGISVLQYGYGVALIALRHSDRQDAAAFGVLALWVVFQAVGAAATAPLRRQLGLGPVTAMLIGALLCGAGPCTLSATSSLAVAVLGYGVLCGAGAGIVYATCLSTVASWYPEQRGAKLGLVSGAFGYGAVPFIALFALVLTPRNHAVVFMAVGLCVLVIVAICGVFFREPPPGWWPAEIDPKVWVVDKRLNRSLLGNAPAIRQYRPGETARTPAFVLMYLILVAASGAALLPIAYIPSIGLAHGSTPAVGATAVGLLALVNGTGRGVASWLSDRLGRRQTLSLALIAMGCALPGLAYSASASASSVAPFLAFAALSGLAGGAFYSLFVSLVADYFGEHSALGNFGLLYSAKLFGGVVGVGLPAVLLAPERLGVAFVAAGLVCLCAALMPRLLRRPGYPVCRLPH